MSPLSRVTLLGGSIATFRDSGPLGPDVWATEFAQPADFSSFASIQHILSHLPAIQMLLNFLLLVQFLGAFALRWLQLFFFQFQGLVHAVADVVRLLVVFNAFLGHIVVVAAAVNVILIADDEVLFPHSPALISTAAFAVV